jgi:hypothetical protein
MKDERSRELDRWKKMVLENPMLHGLSGYFLFLVPCIIYSVVLACLVSAGSYLFWVFKTEFSAYFLCLSVTLSWVIAYKSIYFSAILSFPDKHKPCEEGKQVDILMNSAKNSGYNISQPDSQAINSTKTNTMENDPDSQSTTQLIVRNIGIVILFIYATLLINHGGFLVLVFLWITFHKFLRSADALYRLIIKKRKLTNKEQVQPIIFTVYFTQIVTGILIDNMCPYL